MYIYVYINNGPILNLGTQKAALWKVAILKEI